MRFFEPFVNIHMWALLNAEPLKVSEVRFSTEGTAVQPCCPSSPIDRMSKSYREVFMGYGNEETFILGRRYNTLHSK